MGVNRTPGNIPSKTVPRPNPVSVALPTRGHCHQSVVRPVPSRARRISGTPTRLNLVLGGTDMRYQLTPIFCRPWLLNGLSLKLIESHYENNYGGALRRLNAITEQLESLDFAKAPGYVVNGLKREQLVALNSTLLHELYFASLAFGDGKPTDGLAGALSRDFGSVDRWRSEFVAMASGLAGGSGWVL